MPPCSSVHLIKHWIFKDGFPAVCSLATLFSTVFLSAKAYLQLSALFINAICTNEQCFWPFLVNSNSLSGNKAYQHEAGSALPWTLANQMQLMNTSREYQQQSERERESEGERVREKKINSKSSAKYLQRFAERLCSKCSQIGRRLPCVSFSSRYYESYLYMCV